jgi:hypothetical protein
MKDKKIPNDKRITTPFMTKYERARILGTRALQIRWVADWLSSGACSPVFACRREAGCGIHVLCCLVAQRMHLADMAQNAA